MGDNSDLSINIADRDKKVDILVTSINIADKNGKTNNLGTSIGKLNTERGSGELKHKYRNIK